MLRRNEYSNAFWQNAFSKVRNRNQTLTPGLMGSGLSVQNAYPFFEGLADMLGM